MKIKRIVSISILILGLIIFSQTTLAQSYQFNRNLSYGMRGQDVCQLQKIVLGHSVVVNSRGDCYFGSATQEALASIQQNALNQFYNDQSCTGTNDPLCQFGQSLNNQGYVVSDMTGYFGGVSQQNLPQLANGGVDLTAYNSGYSPLPPQNLASLPPSQVLPNQNTLPNSNTVPSATPPTPSSPNNSTSPTNGSAVPAGASTNGSVAGLRLAGQYNYTMDQIYRGKYKYEPFATAVSDGRGQIFVGDKVTVFGGPNDKDPYNNDPLAIHSECTAAQLDQRDPYMAFRWDYTGTSKTQLLHSYAYFYNPSTGKYALAVPVDWGPAPDAATHATIDASQNLIDALGATQFSRVYFTLVPANGSVTIRCNGRPIQV